MPKSRKTERQMPEGMLKGHKFERKGGEEHKRHMDVADAWIKLFTQGWQDVVIANMHPFPLQANFGDAGELHIRGCKKGELFHKHAIDMPRMSNRDEGEGKYVPIALLPVEQAKSLVDTYALKGGVVWFYADEQPDAEELAEAKDRQLNYYRNLVKHAKDEWNRYHTQVRISDAMRGAAIYLAEKGELSLEGLEWVEKQRAASCPQCGEDRSSKANVCKHCDFPLNPAWCKKYRKDLITKYGLENVEDEAPTQDAFIAGADEDVNKEQLV